MCSRELLRTTLENVLCVTDFKTCHIQKFQITNSTFHIYENMNSIVLTHWITLCRIHFILFPRTLHKCMLLVNCRIYAELAFQCVFGDYLLLGRLKWL